MDIRPIRSDEDHHAALQEIERLWDFPDDSPENDKLDVLATLVESYEKKRWPIDRPTPRDVLDYAVSEMGHTQKELGDLLGSRSLASEVLSGKRRVSLAMAHKINAAWKIPLGLLTAPYEVLAHQQPAVPVKRSITDKYIICLEDGRKFKSLKRHLQTVYGLSPAEYRKKWHLPSDYPMVAPDYEKARAALAKATGRPKKLAQKAKRKVA